ncbi:phosphoheptose isomerase [Patescibacteria group bacterium]|nr:phosphoheptose isomerase [Patescibacteria group bacterium]MBU4512265.1 phosphoheptose isomerase [Patescibacteria group bacterium]MCG2692941.1 phosphoheptose isomerase [Candidatus Parcubacteria bacterium]
MNLKKYLKETFDEHGHKKSPRFSSNFKNFIIDIDGVICEDIPNEEPERMKIASEIPGVKEKINKWYGQGHIITFFTSRTPSLKSVTENWLKEHGFKYHHIIYSKPRGGNYYYIDDGFVRAAKKFN